MTLYISNSTTGMFEFHYREPLHNLVRITKIRSGGQEKIGDNWNVNETALVIEQLERYGARDKKELSGRLASRFHGLTYSYERVITEDDIRQGHADDLQGREEESVKQATSAALGFDRAVRRPDQNRKVPARVTQVEVEEQHDPHEKPRKGAVSFDVSVDPEGDPHTKLPV